MESDQIDEIVYPRKNIILRMWLVGAVVVGAVLLYMLWEDRFQAKCSNDDVFFAVLGIEENGKVIESFSGKSLNARMRKIGLDLRMGHAEALAKVAEVLLNDEDRGNDFSEVPLIWVFASGKTSEICDKAYATNGELFFSTENFCFSIVDESGFAIQLDPSTWTIFHSTSSDAICAVPALRTPPNGIFSFRVEARDHKSKKWQLLGEFPMHRPIEEIQEADDEEEDEVAEDSTAEEKESFIPDILKIRRVSMPKACRFFSSSREDRSAFGEIEIELKMPEDSKLPADVWRIENVSLLAKGVEPAYTLVEQFTAPSEATMEDRDVFHTNVRFLTEDEFETWEHGALRAPLAKALYSKPGTKWEVSAVLVRAHSFLPEEITDFEKLKISKSPTFKEVSGSRISVRAFLTRDYFRLLDDGVPALILEIAGPADLREEDAIFCQPFRVKSETGEDLNVESIVLVKPGVYQYWYLPAKAPKSVQVSYVITRPITVSATLEAEIKP